MASLSPTWVQDSPAPSVTHSRNSPGSLAPGPLQPPLSGPWTSSRSWEAGPWPGLHLLTPQVSLKHHWLRGDFIWSPPPGSTKSPKYGLLGQQGTCPSVILYRVTLWWYLTPCKLCGNHHIVLYWLPRFWPRTGTPGGLAEWMDDAGRGCASL